MAFFIFLILFQMENVLCQICKQTKVYNKYRRHLSLHHSSGEITKSELNEIIFQTKKNRNKSGGKNIKMGYTCSYKYGEHECGKVVQHLSIHLRKQHYLNFSDEEYLNVMKSSKTIEKQTPLFSGTKKVLYNPSFDFSASKSCILNKQIIAQNACSSFESPNSSISFHSPNSSPILIESDNSSPFSFTDDCKGSENDFYITNIINSSISLDLQQLIIGFPEFLGTYGGGCKSKKSVEMDVYNIFIVLNGLGEKEFWNSHRFNELITKELRIGKASTTSHS